MTVEMASLQVSVGARSTLRSTLPSRAGAGSSWAGLLRGRGLDAANARGAAEAGAHLKDGPATETVSQVPLHCWVYFGAPEDADIVVPELPAGTLGRLLVIRRGVILVDHEDRITLHAGVCERDIAGVWLSFVVCDPLPPAVPDDSSVGKYVGFTDSRLYARLEDVLLAAEPGGTRSWSGKSLFTADGVPNDELLWALEQVIGPEVEQGDVHLAEALETALDYLDATINGFGLLDPLVRAHGVKEVLVNRYDEIYVEGSHGMRRSPAKFSSRDVLGRLVESLLARMDTRLDASQPVAQGVVDGRYRVHIISEQICPVGPSLSIRCFPERTFYLKDLIGPRGREVGLEDMLVGFIRDRKNLLICGETSSGKTSLMEALSRHIPANERVIVAEDVRELRLANEHKVYLQTHQGFGASVAEIDLRGLVKESLRMRPDRLIIGECRGGEALDLLQALNTGHEGSMTSIHGSSALAALRRLETLSMFGNARVTRTTAAALIASGVHVVIEMHRNRSGVRCVRSVSYVKGGDPFASGGPEYEVVAEFSEVTA